jgi:hypothetical protein
MEFSVSSSLIKMSSRLAPRNWLEKFDADFIFTVARAHAPSSAAG